VGPKINTIKSDMWDRKYSQSNQICGTENKANQIRYVGPKIKPIKSDMWDQK